MGLAVKTRNFAPTGPNFIWIRERKLMATALDGRIVTKKKKTVKNRKQNTHGSVEIEAANPGRGLDQLQIQQRSRS